MTWQPPDWYALERRHVWHPYTQMATALPPIPVARAKGAYLYTSDGRAILDGISSWWVTLHGHSEERIAEAIAQQARTLDQVIFAGFTHEPASRLAARLTDLAPAVQAGVWRPVGHQNLIRPMKAPKPAGHENYIGGGVSGPVSRGVRGPRSGLDHHALLSLS